MRPLYRAKTITIKLDNFKHFGTGSVVNFQSINQSVLFQAARPIKTTHTRQAGTDRRRIETETDRISKKRVKVTTTH